MTVFPLDPPCILRPIVDTFRGCNNVVDTSVQSHYLPIIILFNYRIRAFIDEIDENPSLPVNSYVRSLELPASRFRITFREELRN